MISFLIPQEPCEGTCLSEEETKNLYNNIQELQFDVEKYKEIEENLNSQICMYIQSDSLYKSQIEDYKTKLQYKDEMIELVNHNGMKINTYGLEWELYLQQVQYI